MAKRNRPAAEKYHDRVAGIYDTIYEGNPYWETVFDITWRHVQKFLPQDLSTRCLDVGCGTGKWGMKLLKGGYPTDFLDISQKMIDQVDKKLQKMTLSYQPRLIHTSIDDMSMIERESYDFLIGQGDPLCCSTRPERAFKDLCRILKPGGIMVMSVDHRYGSLRPFLKEGNIEELKRFVKTGKTQWVTDNEDEQYPETMFTVDQIRKMCEARGLELLSIIGKTALPLRRFQDLLKDRKQREEILRLEENLNSKPEMLGCAAHLEFVAKKPE